MACTFFSELMTERTTPCSSSVPGSGSSYQYA